jgi:hypothetical protein
MAKLSKIASIVGNGLTDIGASASYGIYKGAGKLGKEISLEAAQKMGYGATIGMAGGALMGLANPDSSMVGGSISGAGLGAVGGAGMGAVAAAIAKGIR